MANYVPFGAWISLFYVFAVLPASECYYELSTSEHVVCPSGSSLNATVDLVCRFQEQHSSRMSSNCKVTEIKWYRSSGVNTYEIKTSSKYGVWESVEGWGNERNQRVSLLRIRQFELADVARYSCQVTCDYGSGLSRLAQLSTDVCLQENSIKGLQCPVIISEDTCLYTFQDGRCDHQCDSREHLYDGYDCSVGTAPCAHDDHCARRFANGVCDDRCNSRECQWDGGDCISSALDLALDHILVKVERTRAHSKPNKESHRNDNYKLLARHLSYVTHSLLRIVPEPKSARTEVEYRSTSRDRDSASLDLNIQLLNQQKVYDNIVLKLDNTNCEKKCMRDIHSVAQYLQLSDLSSASPQLNIHAITILREKAELCSASNTDLPHLEITDTKTSLTVNDLRQTADESGPAEPPDPSGSVDPTVVVIGVCVVGTVFILALLIAIFGVMMCMRTEQQRRARTEQQQADKISIQSPFLKEWKKKSVDV